MTFGRAGDRLYEIPVEGFHEAHMGGSVRRWKKLMVVGRDMDCARNLCLVWALAVRGGYVPVSQV